MRLNVPRPASVNSAAQVHRRVGGRDRPGVAPGVRRGTGLVAQVQRGTVAVIVGRRPRRPVSVTVAVSRNRAAA